MAKMKYWDTATTAWKTLDAANGDTVDGIHFRINGGKLQYSTNGSTWVNTGVDTSDATAAAGDIKTGKNAYVNGVKVAGTMPVRNNTDTGGSYPVAVNQSIYPGMLYLTPPAGYYDGTVWVQSALANMTAANIKAGVAFSGNLTGTFTADATATAADIVSGKTAYVNGAKLTGTNTAKKVYSGTFTIYQGGGTQIGTYACPFQPSTVIVTCQNWYNGGYNSKFAFNSTESTTKAILGAYLIDVTFTIVSNGFLITLPGSDFRQNFTVNFTCIG